MTLLWKSVWKLAKNKHINKQKKWNKLKRALPKYHATLLLGIKPKDWLNIHDNTCTPTSQQYSQFPSCGISNDTHNQWIDKENVLYVHNGVLFTCSKWNNYALWRKMDGIWSHNDDHHKAISCVVTYGIWSHNEFDDDIKVRGRYKVDFPGEICGPIEKARRRYWWAKNL
jgi:hypothetical protein